jgi:hypothetical protein
MTAATRPRSFATLSAAPCIWLVHFVGIYSLTSLGCQFATRAGGAYDALHLGIVIVLTLAGVGASAYAIRIHWRDWRGRPYDTDAPNVFLAKTNVFLHVLAIVGMIWVAAPAFLLAPCGR